MRLVTNAHWELMNQLEAERAAHTSSQLRDKQDAIMHLEARNAVLETERRELIERLFARQAAAEQPPQALAPVEDSWNAMMQRKMQEIERGVTDGI